MELDELEVFAFEGGEWTPTPKGRSMAVPIPQLRVLTWNVWFGGHMFEERRVALMVDLETRKPDVICLQEVTAELIADLTESKWVRASYRLSDVELFQTYDIAILSRIPIRRLSSLPLPTQMGRRLLVAELSCGLSIGTVHLESMKESTHARATQLRMIQPCLASLGDAVFCGDMNFQPADAIETAAIDPAFVDVWPVVHPADPGYTDQPDAALTQAGAVAKTHRPRVPARDEMETDGDRADRHRADRWTGQLHIGSLRARVHARTRLS